MWGGTDVADLKFGVEFERRVESIGFINAKSGMLRFYIIKL